MPQWSRDQDMRAVGYGGLNVEVNVALTTTNATLPSTPPRRQGVGGGLPGYRNTERCWEKSQHRSGAEVGTIRLEVVWWGLSING